MAASERRLTREDCRHYLVDKTFRLQPADYGSRYPKWPGAVGLEIEMLPVKPRGDEEVPGRVPLSGPGSLEEPLRRLASREGWMTEETETDAGNRLLRVVLDDGAALTFEPGGQLEFSSNPYPCLSDAVRRMRQIQRLLDTELADAGIEIAQIGINPWHTVEEIGLQMPKGRYRAMDAYYRQIGEYGPRMMRQTCTFQVNLDFGPDAETLARRYLGAMLLAPVAAATFGYSAVVDRRVTGIRGFRTRIWRHTDPTHTGLPGLLQVAAKPSMETCIDTYLEAVLNAEVVFVEALEHKVMGRGFTFGRWLEEPVDGVAPTLGDFATHLSLMFPEVRPRGFLELRSIDCQPRPFQSVPAFYYTGLLYRDEILSRVLELLLPRAAEAESLLARAENGLDAPLLAQLARKVMDLAVEGFQKLAPCFKEDCSERALAFFREHFTSRGRTPADDLLDALGKAPSAVGIPWTILRRLEESWAESLDGCRG